MKTESMTPYREANTVQSSKEDWFASGLTTKNKPDKNMYAGGSNIEPKKNKESEATNDNAS